MAALIIEATKSTPYIHLDDDKHLLAIRGESYPENAAGFYAPVFQWLDGYLASAAKEIKMNIQIIYFNSSSSKVLLDIFDRLEEVAGRGVPVTINWLYHSENDMSLEYGEEFKEEMRQVAFNLIEYTD